MKAETPFLLLAAAGLIWVAWPDAPGDPGGGVVLNRDPPRAPSWDLSWEAWQGPERPIGAPASAPAAGGQSAEKAVPVEGRGWEDEAYAGVWATSAEFSDSD